MGGSVVFGWMRSWAFLARMAAGAFHAVGAAATVVAVVGVVGVTGTGIARRLLIIRLG
jgi:hypothetical protein